MHALLVVSWLLLVLPGVAAAQTPEWTRQFGSAGHDRATAVAVDASGVYVAGATEGALPGQTSAGSIDAFLRKYDRAGTELWTRQFGSSAIDEILALAVDASGVYVAGGALGSLAGGQGAPEQHAFVRKYDAAGTEVWTREFSSGRREQVLGVGVGPSGIYAAGDTTVTAPPFDDGFVVRLALDGALSWGRRIGTPQLDRASAIYVHATGVYVAGATEGTLPGQTSAGDSDGFVRKYDFDGTEIWTRQFGTPEGDEVVALGVDASGVYLAGTTSGALGSDKAADVIDGFAARYTFDGERVWLRQLGTAEYDDILGIAPGAEGVYIGGNTRGALPGQRHAGSQDGFVQRRDQAGAVGWTLQFGTSGHDELLDLDSAGTDVYVVGVTDGALPGQTNLGSVDAFVMKLR
jgi:hypothetical protein